MVFLDMALDRRDRDRERHRQAGYAQGFEDGLEQAKRLLAQGREHGHAEWRAWFERRVTALARGEPFDEPPPGETR